MSSARLTQLTIAVLLGGNSAERDVSLQEWRDRDSRFAVAGAESCGC